MWTKLGRFILKQRIVLLIVLATVTGIMAYFASKLELSYEFSKAIPTDNEKYQTYEAFKKQFGEDGNTLVMGFQSANFFTKEQFNELAALQKRIKAIKGVTGIISIPDAINLYKDSSSEKLIAQAIFQLPIVSQAALDSGLIVFRSLPFYSGLLYNPETNAVVAGISLNKKLINSKARTGLVNSIVDAVKIYEQQTGNSVYMSGLPYIRTILADRIKKEMNFFLIGSLLLSAITLWLFFRSLSATLMSLTVVLMGVVWSLGTMVLFGYKITILNALIPPLVVVIGIPNCIYFLNKYHTVYKETGDKEKALVTMVGRMGIVTLFCNIAAAIGFAVFGLTESALLKEFGWVAGINIMALFFISLAFIPAILSFLAPPTKKQTRYLDSKLLEKILHKTEHWALQKTKWVYIISAIIVLVAGAGLVKLKKEAFIVDDLPKADKIYTDLKWFEQHFKGVMPLEITVDTKKKNGLIRSAKPITAIGEFTEYIANKAEAARPMSFVEALKFAKQAYFGGDSLSYAVPYDGDMAFLGPYLKTKNDTSGKNGINKVVSNFIDSNRQVARISVTMKDIGTERLPLLIKDFENKSAEIFDSASYKISFTGSSITFLEGSTFIINGLRDSILWAFLLITLCMLYLFRSFKILLCSIIPNLIPLVITAGIMGWVGIAIKPSTVLVFSLALGIVIDVTIRFLINYKQELPLHQQHVKQTLVQTIHHTGISIIYTSLVLIAGFIIFCFSDFGGTKALGWLTSLTLLVGTITNLILLPVLINSLLGHRKR